jgi:hypothetical protein
MLDRLIGAVAGLLVAALVLPAIATVASELVTALTLVLVLLFATRVWLNGLGL